MDVFPLLRNHLQALDAADSVRRIEYDNLRTLNVLEALERGFARIAACSYKHKGFILSCKLALCAHNKIRQQSERHILKRAGRTVPQLQHKQPVLYFDHGTGVVAVEARICGVCKIEQLLKSEIIKIQRQNFSRALLIIHLEKAVHKTAV